MTETATQETTRETPTKAYTLNIEVSVIVPATAKEIYAHDGAVAGFELPGGIIIKPEVVFEQSSTSDEDQTKDLTFDEVTALGVYYDIEKRDFDEAL